MGHPQTHGVCEVRSEIYAEGFNELIRQITISCPERGKITKFAIIQGFWGESRFRANMGSLWGAFLISSNLNLGLLLMRVRDEAEARIESYKSLYESSVVFGIRKQVQADEGVKEMEERLRALEKKKTILQNQVSVFEPFLTLFTLF